MIILACNTSSAKALRTIQQKDLKRLGPDKRVLGVIRPSTEIIGKLTKTGKVGILATPGTVSSMSYVIEVAHFSPEVTVYQQACPIWVPLIESNKYDTEAGLKFIKEDIENLLAMNPDMDVIVLGCTHYPFLRPIMKEILPDHISIIDSGEAVAKYTKNVLEKMEREGNDSNAPSHAFYTNGDIAVLQSFVKAINVDIGISKKMEF